MSQDDEDAFYQTTEDPGVSRLFGTPVTTLAPSAYRVTRGRSGLPPKPAPTMPEAPRKESPPEDLDAIYHTNGGVDQKEATDLYAAYGEMAEKGLPIPSPYKVLAQQAKYSGTLFPLVKTVEENTNTR